MGDGVFDGYVLLAFFEDGFGFVYYFVCGVDVGVVEDYV